MDSFNVLQIPEAAVLAAWFNLDPAKPPYKMFSSKAVRQALAYGLDRAGIWQAAYVKTGAVADTAWSPINWGANPNVAHKYPFDANKADQMLDAAGWVRNAQGIREKGAYS